MSHQDRNRQSINPALQRVRGPRMPQGVQGILWSGLLSQPVCEFSFGFLPQFRVGFRDDFLSHTVCTRKRRDEFRDVVSGNSDSLTLHFCHSHSMLNSLEGAIDRTGRPWLSSTIEKQMSGRSIANQTAGDLNSLLRQVDDSRRLFSFHFRPGQNPALIC